MLTCINCPGTPWTDTTVGFDSPAADEVNVLTVWPCSCWVMSLAADTCNCCCRGSRFCSCARVIPVMTWGCCWWCCGGDGLAARGSLGVIGLSWEATVAVASDCCWSCCRSAADREFESLICCPAFPPPSNCWCSWDPILLQVAASRARGDANDFWSYIRRGHK